MHQVFQLLLVVLLATLQTLSRVLWGGVEAAGNNISSYLRNMQLGKNNIRYIAFCNLVRTVILATENVLWDDTILKTEEGMQAFSIYYEDEFYQMKRDR